MTRDLTRIARENRDRAYLVTLDGRETTYGAVSTLAVRLARSFAGSEVPSRTVGVALKRPELYLPTLLACWNRGWIPAMLSPDDPPEKRAVQLAVSGAGAIVTDQPWDAAAATVPIITVSLETSPEIDNDDLPPPKLDPAADPWVLLFTSGSSGFPKCVPLSLNNIASNVEAFAEALDLTAGDVFLSASPLFYAHGLYNTLLTAFLLGTTAVWVGPLSVMSADAALSLALARGATVFHVTPSMLPILTLIGSRRKAPLPRFRRVICGTAKLEAGAKAEFERIFQTSLIQQYGMSETLFMAVNVRGTAAKPLSVGLPVGCRMRLVDPDGQDASEGEVIVRSDAAFGCYYRQPDETAETYRDGWFYTGDLGRFDADGYLTITGRRKEIIKKGGFNVNPHEIEDVLRKLPGVTDASVVALPDPLYGEEIYAFIVAPPGTEDDLLARCDALLPKTHRPRRLRALDRLPTTASGKPDKPKLKALAAEVFGPSNGPA